MQKNNKNGIFKTSFSSTDVDITLSVAYTSINLCSYDYYSLAHAYTQILYIYNVYVHFIMINCEYVLSASRWRERMHTYKHLDCTIFYGCSCHEQYVYLLSQ